ncbi:MAG TPA: Hsp20/alpha crystallin family protein [Chthonomonadaceae bacterium]|jgi:HSP20 family protein|nr:Hsp20/alpha crystallin family protein [Chthonomonadaceae bacterium]
MARQSNNTLVRRPAETISRWDPWTEFDQMRRQMDDMFGRFFGYTPLSRLIPATPGVSYSGDYGLSADLYETNDELVLIAPVPGVTPGDLNIEATADTLTISGERKPFYQNENATQLRQSWWSAGQGAFRAEFSLPVEIDPNQIQAHYRNGVLELHLPKSEAAKPKAVKVHVATEG